MRGTALIVHSLDPETLDRVDDLEYFDPESDDEIDRYSDNNQLHASRIPDERVTDLSYDSCNSSSVLGQGRRGQSVAAAVNSFPIFNPLQSDLSSSPPLTKSHYEVESKENYDSHYALNNQSRTQINRPFHSGTNYPHDYTEPKPNRMKEKTFTSLGSGMLLSRVKNSRNEIVDGKSDKSDEGRSNNSGFARFLSGFDFRQSKANASKINVYNLPPQLREELKHIYVY